MAQCGGGMGRLPRPTCPEYVRKCPPCAYSSISASAEGFDLVYSSTRARTSHSNSIPVLGSSAVPAMVHSWRWDQGRRPTFSASARPAISSSQVHDLCFGRLASHHPVNPFGPALQRPPFLADVLGFVVGPGNT